MVKGLCHHHPAGKRFHGEGWGTNSEQPLIYLENSAGIMWKFFELGNNLVFSCSLCFKESFGHDFGDSRL